LREGLIPLPLRSGGSCRAAIEGGFAFRFPRLRGKLPGGVKGAGAAVEAYPRGDAKSAPFRPPATFPRSAGEGIDGRHPATLARPDGRARSRCRRGRVWLRFPRLRGKLPGGVKGALLLRSPCAAGEELSRSD